MSKSDDNKRDEIVRQLDDDIFVAMFRKGAYEYLKDGISDEDYGPNDMLSKTREESIMRLIKKEIRKEKTGKIIKTSMKVAVIFLIVLAVCTITIMSVEAFRVPVFNLFIKNNEDSTDVSVGKEDISGGSTQEYMSNSIYLPAGFELSSTEEYAETTKYIYSNSEGLAIVINRYSLGSYFGIDSEDAEIGQVDINGVEGLYSIKNGIILMTFKTVEYAYLIQAPIDLTEVIKIAESIH